MIGRALPTLMRLGGGNVIKRMNVASLRLRGLG